MRLKYIGKWRKMEQNILCIDDIESNLFTLKSVLNSVEGSLLNIFTALSANDGLDILIKEKIDLILLDIMMPEVDGFSMARIIKSNKKTKNIPIIFVTAKTDDKTIKKCYEVGGSDYINKPFNSVELIKRVLFHIKLSNSEKLLKKEKEYAQSVIDLQDNFIVVTNEIQAISVNQSVLDFFGLNDLSSFQKKYKCICHTFIEEDDYFYLSKDSDSTLWVEKVISLLEIGDVVVKIKNKYGDNHVFAIKAKLFYDVYIVSLTDITTISKKSKEFEHEANFDNLTQIYNRNMFHRLMEEKIRNVSLTHGNICFAILDIDHFKAVNDTYGHLVGDDVLKHLTNLIQKHIRENDIFARWGGEEFILALEVDMKKAIKVIENIRAMIEKEEFEEVKHITCSFGVTEFRKNDTTNSMTKRADKALYEAKESGRNRVCQN